MLSDFKFFRRNPGRNAPAEANNENADPLDGPAAQPGAGSSRAPLNTIQEPVVNTRVEPDQEAAPRRKLERTPSKTGQTRAHDPAAATAAAALGTPEKPPLSATPAGAARNRFGWAMRNESGSWVSRTGEDAGYPVTGTCPAPLGRGSGTGVGVSLGPTTPRVCRTAGRVLSMHSESSSTQSTPTKSVNKPPNPGLGGSRPSLCMSNRSVNAASGSRGIPISSFPTSVVNTVEVPQFELREDPSFWMDHNVQVVIRVRPLNSTERSLQGYNRCLKQENSQNVLWIGQPETRFSFDHAACETINQETLFRVVGLPMVENCMSGYNSCVFAYGQTGSGKTYTMLGEIDELDLRPSPDRGMTPRIFEFLFARIRAEEESRRDEKLKYNCRCSFLEIYNEQITDLLDPSSTNLLLREDIHKGVYVENLSEFEVETVNDILRLLIQGAANRKIAATHMNRESSRSHCVFTCVIESRWEKDSTTNLRFARLNLVDLAGSERQKTSGAEGERLKEAANINKSLSTLGHVIMVLVDVARGKPRHVPYRDSRLTFLLQDSLGGNSKTMIIANVSPSICCASETLSTLKFAQRAKLIQNNAIINEDATGDVVALQHQIQLLKDELSVLKRRNVSRSLSFRTEILHDSDCERFDAPHMDVVPEVSQGSGNDADEYEASASVTVSSKQLKSLETVLAGALRREKMADTTIKQLEAEIEHLNRLVRQREEDTQCTKMMLKFREDKIHRMESIVDGLVPAESYLLEERNSLFEEIQLLRSKVDRNPEVTRFALENIRLLDQLRRFQDFFEEGERELLLTEVSELRDQLVHLLEGKFNIDEKQNLNTETQHAHVGTTDSTAECDALHIKLKRTCEELEDCRNKLNCCLDLNAKLTKEIDTLHGQLNNLNSVCETNADPDDMELSPGFPSMENYLYDEEIKGSDDATVNHGEQVVHLQLELDILKTILGEERSSRAELEERTSRERDRLLMAEENILQMSKLYEDAKNGLSDARYIIEALESEQLLLITELDELRESNKLNSGVAKKQHMEMSSLKEKIGTRHEDEKKQSFMLQQLKQQSLKCLGNRSSLQVKMERTRGTLEKGHVLNMGHQGSQELWCSDELEMDEIHRQVEAETAEVIVCLQEEVSTLRQQVENNTKNEVAANQSFTELELEMKDVQERLYHVTQDNERLNELIELKDEQVRCLSEEWETVAYDIAEVLADGDTALADALTHAGSIVDSFPPRAWVEEQVGRMIRAISEKDALIEELQRCLDGAQKVRCDMEWKLRSLRGATLAITEAQQQETNDKEKEILQLTSQLSEKTMDICKLQNTIKLGEEQIKKAEILATVAFMTVNRMFEINSVHIEALEEKQIQVTYYDSMHLQKDAILKDQVAINAGLGKHIRALQFQLVEYEDNIIGLQLRLAEEQERVCSMESQLKKAEKDLALSVSLDDLLKASEKLNQLILGVNRLYLLMNQHVEQTKGLIKECTLGEHAISGSENWAGIESTIHTSDAWHNFPSMPDERTRAPICNTTKESSQCKGKYFTAYDSNTIMILLEKEMESALGKLQAVQDQMHTLLDEKEKIKESEMQSRKMIENISDKMIGMEKDINDKEKEFELRLLELDQKMRTAVGKVNDSIACWKENKQELELEVRDARLIAAQKTTEASTILAKFEEAQETMREADIMVNELVAANQSAKFEAQRCLKTETVLTCERDHLVRQVQDLHSSLCMKNEEYAHLEKEFDSYFSDLFQLRSLILSLESVIREVQITFSEELRSIIRDTHWLKSQVSHFSDLARKWLEHIWSEIIGKDCAVSVLHVCHMGIMLEIITGLNAENGLLQCGLCESNAVIADLRTHNDRAKKELEMCSYLKGKLLVDINSSFSRIMRKESDGGELKTKLSTLEKKIMDLQLQEESMLIRSNLMGSEISVLMKDLDKDNKDFLEELCLKDFESLIFMSELKEKIIESKVESVHLYDLEKEKNSCINFIEKIKEEISTLMVQKELESELLLDMEAETDILKQEVIKTNRQLEAVNHDSFNILDRLKEKEEMIKEMQVKMGTYKCDCQQSILRELESKDQISRLQTALEDKSMKLRDFEQSHEMVLKELILKNVETQILAEIMDAMSTENSKLKAEMCTHFELLQNEKVRILEDLKVKEAALQSSSCVLSVLSQENCQLQDEILHLHVSVSNLEGELEKKVTEVTDVKNSNSIMCSDLQLERSKMATLACKLDTLHRENENLKNEIQKLSMENFTAIDCFRQKGNESGFSFTSIQYSNLVNHSLTDIICSLYNCINNLQTELNTKSSELDEARHSHSLLSRKLDSKCQDQETQIMKATALKLENETLRNEILSINQKKVDMCNLLSFFQKCNSDFVQYMDIILNALTQLLEGNNMKLIDKMIQDFGECIEMVSYFAANLEFLEVSVKEMLSENLFLQSELVRKDEASKDLLFDLHLLQRSASIARDEKNKTEEMAAALQSLEDKIAAESNDLDEAVAHSQMLELQIAEKIIMITTLESDLAKESESKKLLAGENVGLKAQIETIVLVKNSIGQELSENSKLVEKLETELIDARTFVNRKKHFLEDLQNEVFKLTDEREHLDSMILDLKEQLDMAHAFVEENEAIAVEARQTAESRMAYAEEKEEEVRLLETSVEELECTVNMLQNKVEILEVEAQRQRLEREDLEMRLQELTNKMVALQNSSDSRKITERGNADLLRHLDEKVSELEDAQKQIDSLQKDVADKKAEITQCKAHIFELNMHAEAQARENKLRIKELEVMAQQVKMESLSSHMASLTSNKHEKTAVKSRGSGSPFKCIGLGLTQQMNSEKDEELSAARTRIQELESLSTTQQKEIFMLNTRLANSESMTHDAIRDLLGVKLTMTNYASLLDEPTIQKMVQSVAFQSEMSGEKEEIAKLKKQMDEFIEERQGWLDEIKRTHRDMVAARTAIEKLRQREQSLTTENEMLKGEIVKHEKVVLELEDEIKKLEKQQNLQQRIHHHVKIKEENNVLKIENVELLTKLRRSEEILSRVKEELARYRISCGKSPYIDIDEEQQLKTKLENTEEERVQLSQKLMGLCTDILKAAGITRPVSEISLAMAEDALNQLKGRINSLESELQDLQLKSKISGEKVRLSEFRWSSSVSSPIYSRTYENLTMSRGSPSPSSHFSSPLYSGMNENLLLSRGSPSPTSHFSSLR